MKKKISLVLEGGGMRGAYTAGCLSWLIDEGIEFDGAYGISTGAVHLSTYLFKNKEWLLKASTEVIANKKYIGANAFVHAGQIVDYDSMFKDFRENYGFDIDNLKTDVKAKIGLYDLNEGKTVYLPISDIDESLLKAACSLPLLGKTTKKNGHKYLDGGITKMIPIEESIKDGYTKHLIITTKPIDYVRKPSNKIVVKLMKTFYPDCPNMSKDYEVRHINYNKQIGIINDLVKSGDALYRYPTGEVNVTRLGGSTKDLISLFEMGRNDMENMREDIYKLIK